MTKDLDWLERMGKALGETTNVYDEFIWILNDVCTQEVFNTPESRLLFGRFCNKAITRVEELSDSRKCSDPIIEDGFGNAWSERCPLCKELSMQVMRPGSVQCGNEDCPQWDEDYGEPDGD